MVWGALGGRGGRPVGAAARGRVFMVGVADGGDCER